MGLSIERVEFLLLIAAAVSMLARKLKLPYTVGLVVAGLAVAVLRLPFEAVLTKHLIFTAFLPPLIFEAAFPNALEVLKARYARHPHAGNAWCPIIDRAGNRRRYIFAPLGRGRPRSSWAF